MTGFSHDSANRFLHRENYQPKGMVDEVIRNLSPIGSILSVDDGILDKPYSDRHWQIEQYHRAIKQVCHIEYFQVCSERPVRNHIFTAILAFVYLQKMLLAQEFTNIYQYQRELFKETVGAFVDSFAKGNAATAKICQCHLLLKFSNVIYC